MAQENSTPISAVSMHVRLLWGAGAMGLPLMCWRLLAGEWPDVASAWWFWLVCLILALLAVSLCPIPMVLWRTAGALSYVQTDAFRLSNRNMWTEVTHVATSGAIQQMRMEDGSLLSLSAAITTIAVFVRPRAESMDDVTVLAEFPIQNPEQRGQLSREERSREDEVLLFQLRKAIGWPKDVVELRRVLDGIRDLVLDAKTVPPRSVHKRPASSNH